MSIRAVPYQPVNLVGSKLIGCICDPLEPPTLIGEDDAFEFVLRAFSCANAEQLFDNTNFDANTWMANVSFVIQPGSACCSTNNAGSRLGETSFTPIPGTTYELRLTITDIQGSVTVTLGGLVETIYEPGQYSYTFTATSTQKFRLELNDASSLVCVTSALVFEGNRSITVTFRDAETDDAFSSINATDDPDYFTYNGETVTVSIPMSSVGMGLCSFYAEVTDCDNEGTLVSQVFQVVDDTACTVLLSSCNDRDAMGLPGTFTPRLRVEGKVVRMRGEYEVSEERRSNGRWNRHYADLQLKYELRIDLQNERTLQYLAALPLFDHFYVEQQEYSIDAESFEPTYEDVFDAVGGLILSIRPKQELIRNVRCDAENIAGCPPPPNYLVQGTGPNSDYILTQAGDRILLA